MPRNHFSLTLALAATLALSACKATDKASPTTQSSERLTAASLTTERQRVSYLVGLDHARQLDPIKDEIDIETVIQAIRTAHAGEKPLLEAAQTDAIRAQFAQHLRDKHDAEQLALATRNGKLSEAFLAGNATQPGVTTTASGLQYQVLRTAAGAKPKPTDTVRVNYVGSLIDGHAFESTYATDHPAEFVLNRVMPGWTEAVALMPVGSKYKFWIPPALAYQERGVAGQIEPNALLVFEVELLQIARP